MNQSNGPGPGGPGNGPGNDPGNPGDPGDGPGDPGDPGDPGHPATAPATVPPTAQATATSTQAAPVWLRGPPHGARRVSSTTRRLGPVCPPPPGGMDPGPRDPGNGPGDPGNGPGDDARTLARARDACFAFLALENLADVRQLLADGFTTRDVLALRLVWLLPLADFMAHNAFPLRCAVPGCQSAQLPGCSLAEWMWNSAVDCFLRNNWVTVAIVGSYPLYLMHHQSPGVAVNMLAGVDVYTSLWDPAQLPALKASFERVLGSRLDELDPADFGARADREGDSPVYIATDGGASQATRLRVGGTKKERLDALRFVWAVDPPLRQRSRPHILGWRCARLDRVVVVHLHHHTRVPGRSTYAATPVPGPDTGAWDGGHWAHAPADPNMLLACVMDAGAFTTASLAYWPGPVGGRASPCAGPPITLLALDADLLALARGGRNMCFCTPLTRCHIDLTTPRQRLYEARGFRLAPGWHYVAHRRFGAPVRD